MSKESGDRIENKERKDRERRWVHVAKDSRHLPAGMGQELSKNEEHMDSWDSPQNPVSLSVSVTPM